MSRYDNPDYFAVYAQMSCSREDLDGTGERDSYFPDLRGMDVLDLGCSFSQHCNYAANLGSKSVLGINQCELMKPTLRSTDAC